MSTNDTISRQAAIDAFDLPIYNIKGKENAERMVEYLKTVIRRIKNLPTAQPESGKWIPCSERLPEPYKGAETEDRDAERRTDEQIRGFGL